MKFWIFWGIDALVFIIFLYFFVVGLIDQSVSSFNIGLWSMLLILLMSILGASLWLRQSGQNGLALIVLLIAAVPAILAGIFFLIVLMMNPKWN